MFTALFVIFAICVFGDLLWLCIKLAWSAWKVVLTLVCLPLTKTVKNIKIEEKEGEKYFDVKIPDSDSPSLSEGQKKLAEIAEKFGLEGFGNIVVDDDGRLKIQAEFENFDADLYLSRIEEQSYLHCWDRLPSEFPKE